ncbi:MAG: hypothetical protein FJ137_00895 [Deltaproteobacteria bacterium]|nr:hypothetical protein [Deltaproteobacteria bacterium]
MSIPSLLCVASLLAAATPASTPLAPTPPASSSTVASPPAAPKDASTAASVASPPAPPRPRVLVLDVAGDLDPSARATLTALVTARLARFDGLEVVARDSLARLVDVEADKQAAGCAGDDGGCLAEVAGALDVDYLAVATAGQLGGTTVFTLQLVDRGGKTSGRGTAQVSALDDLAARVTTVIDEVGTQVTGAAPSSGEPDGGGAPGAAPPWPTTLPAGAKSSLLVAGGVGAGVGVLALALGVTPAVLYSGAAGGLRTLRVDYVASGGDPALVERAGERQQDAVALQGLWNNAGIYAAWGGFLVAAAGGGAIAAALLVPEAP